MEARIPNVDGSSDKRDFVKIVPHSRVTVLRLDECVKCQVPPRIYLHEYGRNLCTNPSHCLSKFFCTKAPRD